jgi:hypothetical protein
MKILINSQPKSGTHLLKRFCDLIDAKRYPMDLMGSLLRQTSRNPLRNWIKGQHTSQYGIGIDLSFPENKAKREWLFKKLSKVPDNHYILGHAPYSEELFKLLTSLDFKVIQIYRNPRDIVVSLMNHFLRFSNYPLHEEFVGTATTEERLLLSIKGIYKNNGGVAPLSTRIRGAKGWKHNDQVLSVEFEKLIGEKGDGTKKEQLDLLASMLEFVGQDVSKVSQIANEIFFEGAETFNKGKINQSEKLFTPTVEEAFLREMALLDDNDTHL